MLIPRELPRDPAGAVARIRADLARRRRQEARSLAHLLRENAATAEVGNLCSAVVATAEGFLSLARELFARVPEAMTLEHAPNELVSVLCEADEVGEAVRACREFIGLCASAERELAPWAIAASTELEHGRLNEARALLEATRVALWGGMEDRQGLNGSRAALLLDAGPSPLRSGATDPSDARVVVIDPSSPAAHRDPTDMELLGLLGQLAKLPHPTWVDTPNARGLGDLVTCLGATSSARNGVRVSLDVLDTLSDVTDEWLASSWILVHGTRIDMDLVRRLPSLLRSERCIVLSVEVADARALTSDLLSWLRRCQPVGCRTWSAVLLLRQAGVKAFFAGSLVAMSGTLIGPLRSLVNARLEGGDRSASVSNALKARLVSAAHQLLAGLDDEADRATSVDRYLQALASGRSLRFEPKGETRLQLEGLVDLSAGDLRMMNARFEARLGAVLGPVTANEPAESVFNAWREACKQDLHEADRYCGGYEALPEVSLDIDRVVATVRATRRGRQTEPGALRIELAFAVDDRLRAPLPVVLQSIIEHTSAPMRAHVLARGLDKEYAAAIERDFGATLEVIFYDFGSVDYGTGLRMLPHTTVSTLDRLLLPELLPELDKIIYLDADLLVDADIAELWMLDLHGRRLAAKSSSSPGARYAYQMVHHALAGLPSSRGSDARRHLYDNYPLLCRAFNAGVLIMNLARMRAEQFARLFIPMVQNYGMNDQDVLNVYAAADRVELDPAWNAIPRQDLTDGAKIVHFAGPVKPWSELYVARARDFNACEARYLARTGRSSG